MCDEMNMYMETREGKTRKATERELFRAGEKNGQQGRGK